MPHELAQLPHELLKHIISFSIADDIFSNSPSTTVKNQIKFMATFQSIAMQINSNTEMMQYFDDFWIKVAHRCFCIGWKGGHDEKLLHILNNNSKEGLKRKILLARHASYLLKKQLGLYVKNLTIVLLGEMAVGKSSIVLRYVRDEFLEYDPTIEDWFEKQTDIIGYQVNLNIIDTVDYDEVDSLRLERQCISIGECFIIVSSLDILPEGTLKYYGQKIVRTKDKLIHDMPIIFAINKMDLLESYEGDLSKLKEEINETIQDLQLTNTAIIECSAKNSQNISSLFEECISRADYKPLDYLMVLENVFKFDSHYLKEISLVQKKKRCILQ